MISCRYKCPKCGYEAHAADAPYNRGIVGVAPVTPMVCTHCHEVVEVEFVGKTDYLACPGCKQKGGLQKWDLEKFPCPKCKTNMKQEQSDIEITY